MMTPDLTLEDPPSFTLPPSLIEAERKAAAMAANFLLHGGEGPYAALIRHVYNEADAFADVLVKGAVVLYLSAHGEMDTRLQAFFQKVDGASPRDKVRLSGRFGLAFELELGPKGSLTDVSSDLHRMIAQLDTLAEELV